MLGARSVKKIETMSKLPDYHNLARQKSENLKRCFAHSGIPLNLIQHRPNLNQYES